VSEKKNRTCGASKNSFSDSFTLNSVFRVSRHSQIFFSNISFFLDQKQKSISTVEMLLENSVLCSPR